MVVTLIRVYANPLLVHLTPTKNVKSQETGRGLVTEKKGGEDPPPLGCGAGALSIKTAQEQPSAAHWAGNPGLLCDLGRSLVRGPGAPSAGPRVLSQRKRRAKQ